MLLRRHWVTNVPWLLLAVLMIFFPWFLNSSPMFAFLPNRFRLVINLVWYLVLLSFIFEKFLTWFFNVYIITDERVIDVDFYSLIYREVSQAKIDRIQDITYKGGGLLRSVANFGRVEIQTAGDVPQIAFEHVPQPARVIRVLDHLIMEEEQEKINGRVK